jgi:hypothetical protein
MDVGPDRGAATSSAKEDATSRQALTLADLPNEVVVAILSTLCLCHHCSHDGTILRGNPADVYMATQTNLTALSSVAKTCRAMRLLAQPILHHGIPAAIYAARNGSFRLYQFVRTIAMRPDLASSVRFLALDTLVSHLAPCAPRTAADILPNDQETEIIAQRASELGLCAPEDWGAAMIFDANDIPQPANTSRLLQVDEPTAVFVAALAIGLCDKVQVVEFTKIRGICHPYMFHHIIKPLYGKRGLSNIHRLSIGGEYLDRREHWDDISGLDIRQLDGLAQHMPQLREVEVRCGFLLDPTPTARLIHRNTEIPVEFKFPRAAVDLGVLVRLDLILCSATDAGLAELLANCANLQVFSYVSMYNGVHIRRRNFGAALLPDGITNLLTRSVHLHRTLRQLTLEHYPMNETGAAGAYTSLQALEAVTEVHLGAIGLFSKPQDNPHYYAPAGPGLPALPQPLGRILPPNTATLNIFQVGDWKQRASDAVLKLLEVIRVEGRFRRLRQIRVWTDQLWPRPHVYGARPSVERWVPGIADEAAALGIEFCIDGPADEVIQRLRLT